MGRASVILSDGYLQLTRNQPTTLCTASCSPFLPLPYSTLQCHHPFVRVTVVVTRKSRKFKGSPARQLVRRSLLCMSHVCLSSWQWVFFFFFLLPILYKVTLIILCGFCGFFLFLNI